MTLSIQPISPFASIVQNKVWARVRQKIHIKEFPKDPQSRVRFACCVCGATDTAPLEQLTQTGYFGCIPCSLERTDE